MERRSFLKKLVVAAIAVIVAPNFVVPKTDRVKRVYTFAVPGEMMKDENEFTRELNYLLRSKGLRDPDEIEMGYRGVDFVDNVMTVACIYYK
jgi:hypothetical protein